MEKPIVINLPRQAVASEQCAKSILNEFSLNKDNCVWITIGEPGESFQHVNSYALVNIPTLQICFWDLTKITEYFDISNGVNLTLHPPTKEDAIQIVDFIEANKDKNILVNCAAGVSRSGAVAQFCSDVYGHKWIERGKRNAVPNSALYRKMYKYHTDPAGIIE